jgi:hypothetical protein
VNQPKAKLPRNQSPASTAKALGPDVPTSILLSADEPIE